MPAQTQFKCNFMIVQKRDPEMYPMGVSKSLGERTFYTWDTFSAAVTKALAYTISDVHEMMITVEFQSEHVPVREQVRLTPSNKAKTLPALKKYVEEFTIPSLDEVLA